MKYTTKRSKVEEVVIDLEDGCVLKLGGQNITSASIEQVNEKFQWADKVSYHFSHFLIYLSLKNGIEYTFTTKDKVLIDNLSDLTSN